MLRRRTKWFLHVLVFDIFGNIHSGLVQIRDHFLDVFRIGERGCRIERVSDSLIIVVKVLFAPDSNDPTLESCRREDTVVLCPVVDEEVAEVFGRHAQHSFSRLLEAIDPLVVGTVGHGHVQNQTPIESGRVAATFLTSIREDQILFH